jgi:hypothetical protein
MLKDHATFIGMQVPSVSRYISTSMFRLCTCIQVWISEHALILVQLTAGFIAVHRETDPKVEECPLKKY